MADEYIPDHEFWGDGSPEKVEEAQPDYDAVYPDLPAVVDNMHVAADSPLHSQTVRTADGVLDEHEYADRGRKEAYFDSEKGMVYRGEEPDRRGHNDR